MKDDYNTNSHYLTYTFLFRKVGRMYFLNLGVKGLNIIFQIEHDPIWTTNTTGQPLYDTNGTHVIKIWKYRLSYGYDWHITVING